MPIWLFLCEPRCFKCRPLSCLANNNTTILSGTGAALQEQTQQQHAAMPNVAVLPSPVLAHRTKQIRAKPTAHVPHHASLVLRDRPVTVQRTLTRHLAQHGACVDTRWAARLRPAICTPSACIRTRSVIPLKIVHRRRSSNGSSDPSATTIQPFAPQPRTTTPKPTNCSGQCAPPSTTNPIEMPNSATPPRPFMVLATPLCFPADAICGGIHQVCAPR